MNKIEYCIVNWEPKVDMTVETAKEVRTAIRFFKKGIKHSTYSETSQIRLTAMAIADEFVPERESIGGYREFLDAIEAKCKELIEGT